MPQPIVIAPALLGALAFASAVYWGIALGRIVVTQRRVPMASSGVDLAAKRPPKETVHVFVPAHNEELHIESLVESLRAQTHERFRVTLALDRCTDVTAERARAAIGCDRPDERFEIIEIDECPEGWAGKVHAVWLAMQRTRFNDETPPDALLFIDADTRLDPACLAATLALASDRDLDVLSLLSTLTTERWFERVAQPSAGMELVYQFPLLRCNGRSCTRPFANGQFMLFRRSSYEAIGGHEAVKDELLEDLALARLIAERDMNAGVFIADGILRCRMYESWSEFTRGWKRIYTEASRRKQGRLFKRGWRKRLTGSIMPVGSAASAIVGAIMLSANQDLYTAAAASWALAGGALGLLAYAGVAGIVLVGLRVPIVHVATFPIGAWLVGGILLAAAKDLRTGAPTRWGGRSYVRESR